MATPVIYRGDDTGFNGAAPVVVNVKADFDLDGCTATLELGGRAWRLEGLSGREASFSLSWTAAETTAMAVGTHRATVRIADAEGRVRTVSDSVRIRVTDDLAEAYGGASAQEVDVEVESGSAEPLKGETVETGTVSKMREAVKRIAEALGATATALALCAAPFEARGAEVAKAPLGDLDLDANPAVVTNVIFDGLATTDALNAVSNSLSSDVSSALASANAHADAATNALAAALSAEIASAAPADYANVSNRAVGAVQPDDLAKVATSGDYADLANKPAIPTVPTNVSAFANDAGYLTTHQSLDGYATTNALAAAVADAGKVKSVNGATGDVEVTAAGIGAATTGAVAEVSQSVGEVWTYLKGDNFRVVVTNYDSAVNPARTRYEYRMTTNEAWKVVWREADGLADAVAEATNLAATATAAEIAKPANRAWGGWDSHTGEAAPDGVAQISGEGGLLLGGGGGWTQVSSGAGSYWVLASTDPTICATAADGKFSITDPDGNAVMTVTKSDRRLVYATAGGITAGASSVVVQYSVASAEHPTCEMATDLSGAWYAEGDASAPFAVAWSGSSGAWVMTATAPSGGSFPKTGFFRATYTAGGDTVTAFGKGVRFDGGIVIDGTTFEVGTATVDGKKVLTLTAQ